MPDDLDAAFDVLKALLSKHAKRLAVKADTPSEYSLVTKSPSPFPQHKGQPMWFGAVQKGRAYVSLHLMPIYMDAALAKSISPALKKRMQGKTCFNFKAPPALELTAELRRLTEGSVKAWSAKKWL